MTDHDLLLRTVLTDPGDDAPRLVYADWHEEYGQPERAEFVRAQIELAAVDAEVESLGKCHCSGPDPTGCSRCRAGQKRGLWVRRGRLRVREKQLLESMVHGVCDKHGRRQNTYAMYAWVPPGLWSFNASQWQWRRGFVESISLPLKAFMEHAATLFAAHPIVNVTLTDREPRAVGSHGRVHWVRNLLDRSFYDYSAIAHRLPGDLHQLLRSPYEWQVPFCPFDTPEAAQDALSDACVRFGRRLAGLPPF